MKKTLKIIAALLIMPIIFIMVSCNSADQSGNEKSDDLNNTVENINADSAEEAQAESEIPFPHESRDYGGIPFKIAIDKQWSGNSLDITDYDIETMTGEVLNDAIYTRNLLIEEMYNIKIEATHFDDSIETQVNKLIKAGLDEYDAVTPRLMHAATFASKGYGVNVFDTDLTLDAPWWDQNIINDTSIGGAAYFIAGDIFIKHYDGIAMLMFNKKLLSDFGLESPYNLVADNQWTMDKFNEMVKADGLTFDLDGDGKFTRYDRYGFNTQADYVTSFINASGEKLVAKDSNDLPVFNGASEKISNILNKMNEVYLDDTYCMHRDAYGKESGSGQLVQFWVFPEGRSLFYWGFPRYMDLGLRDMEDDFGIIPIPKWNSEQTRYYATLNNWHSYTYMIPITVLDIEKSSQIIDAMAYYGRQLIKPAYYDVCLQRKYTRDDESSAMLDIIFSSTVYDLGTAYGIGGWTGVLEDAIQKNNLNITSLYEKNEGKIVKDIDKLIENFEIAANQ